MLEGADPTQEDSAHVSTEEVRPGVSGAGGPDVSRAAGRAGRVEAGRSTACRRAVGPESGDAAQLGRGTGPGRVRAQPGAAVGGIGGGPGTSAAGGGAGTRERDPQDLGRVFRPGGARPPTQVIVDYIDSYRGRFGVEPVCAVLAEAGIQIAPSSYYARSKARLTEAELDDAYLANALRSLWQDNWGVYGARKLWHAARRGGPQHRPRPGGPADEDRRDRRHRPREASHRHHRARPDRAAAS